MALPQPPLGKQNEMLSRSSEGVRPLRFFPLRDRYGVLREGSKGGEGRACNHPP
jgi:hypothetical protein